MDMRDSHEDFRIDFAVCIRVIFEGVAVHGFFLGGNLFLAKTHFGIGSYMSKL